MHYNKLVRDKIPEIIKESGSTPVTHKASAGEFHRKLVDKLAEEVIEFQKDEHSEELVDILEVTYALAQLSKISPQKLEKLRKEKLAQKGGFDKKIILVRTDP